MTASDMLLIPEFLRVMRAGGVLVVCRRVSCKHSRCAATCCGGHTYIIDQVHGVFGRHAQQQRGTKAPLHAKYDYLDVVSFGHKCV